MTVNISYSDGTKDGTLRSNHSSYWIALAGGGTFTGGSGGTVGYWGQQLSGDHYIFETFLDFTYTAPTVERVVSAAFRFYHSAVWGSGVSRMLQVYEYDHGGAVTSADWRDGTWLGANSRLVDMSGAQQSNGMFIEGGSPDLATRLVSAGPLRVVIASSRTSSLTPPTDVEYNTLNCGASGTATGPALVWTTIPVSTHDHVSGAQVRLSTGAWAYLGSDGAASPAITLYHRATGGSPTTVATIPIGASSTDFRLYGGLQSLALVVDSSDNLYVIGDSGNGLGANLLVLPYVKGGGTTWTLGTPRSYATPAYNWGVVQTLAAVWHDLGTAGTILCVAVRGSGDWAYAPTNDATYALLSCDYLLNGVGSLVKSQGSAMNLLVDQVADATRYTRPCNEIGTSLDVAVCPGAPTRGMVIGMSARSTPGVNSYHYGWRYILSSDGSAIGSTAQATAVSPWATKDPNSKMRVLVLSSTVFVIVTMDADTGYGPEISAVMNSGSSSSFTQLAWIRLDADGPASLPAASTLAVTAAWDVVYNPEDGKIWLYYIDTAAPRRLLRTSVDTNTWRANADEVQVTAALGTGAASVARSIRVERNNRQGTSDILVSVAVDTSGVLTTSRYDDSFNVAPDAPTLTAKTNFDAAAATTFGWTFSDPNASDTQSAYQLQVDTTAGVLAYDSGEIASATAAYVAVGSKAEADNASLVPALPAGVQTGDLLLLLAAIRNSGTGTPNTPSGWTKLLDLANCCLFGKIHSGVESAPTVSFTGGAAGATTLAQTSALRNVPLHVISSATQLNGSAQNVAYPALAITQDNCAVLTVGWKQDDWAATGDVTGGPGSKISASGYSTLGDDAGIFWYRSLQTAAANISAGTVTVATGGAAISRAGVVTLGPAGHTPTGATHSLIANGVANEASYRWRVRNWDAAGLVGAWSSYGTFSTSASGTVTVTDPAADNPAGVVTDFYEIAWSVAGTIQASYRVVVTRVDDSTTLVDTGYVTSVDTSYLVENMLSDIQYQVSVTVRNAALVVSGAGTRLITPSYAAPEIPTLTVAVYDNSGYNLLTVHNPPPGSPSLGTTPDGFETGVTGYTATACNFTQSASAAYTGTYSAMLEVTGTPVQAYARQDAAHRVTVVAGSRYTVSFWAYSVAGYADAAISIDWWDVGGGYIDTSSVAVSIPAATWTFCSYTAEAPAGSVAAAFGPNLTSSPPTGEKIWVDELLLANASDRPIPTSNILYRRRADGTGDTATLTSTLGLDGTWRDYTAASGVVYEYMVRAVALVGTTDSAWSADTTLTLVGVWLHDPLDPQDTIYQYPYGRSARSGGIEVASKAQQYAGRTHPVVDYGENQLTTYQVQAVIPYGPTWDADLAAIRAFAEYRRTLMFRDNRGRAVYADFDGYKETDTDSGFTVSFSITEVDYTTV